jgi:hypothetical protein
VVPAKRRFLNLTTLINMQENIYRVTLFNTRWKDEMITYDCVALPQVNDIIHLTATPDLFIIKERGFNVYNDIGFQNVVLYGMMEADDHQPQHHWERFLNTLKRDHSKRELYNLNNFLDDSIQ